MNSKALEALVKFNSKVVPLEAVTGILHMVKKNYPDSEVPNVNWKFNVSGNCSNDVFEFFIKEYVRVIKEIVPEDYLWRCTVPLAPYDVSLPEKALEEALIRARDVRKKIEPLKEMEEKMQVTGLFELIIGIYLREFARHTSMRSIEPLVKNISKYMTSLLNIPVFIRASGEDIRLKAIGTPQEIASALSALFVSIVRASSGIYKDASKEAISLVKVVLYSAWDLRVTSMVSSLLFERTQYSLVSTGTPTLDKELGGGVYTPFIISLKGEFSLEMYLLLAAFVNHGLIGGEDVLVVYSQMDGERLLDMSTRDVSGVLKMLHHTSEDLKNITNCIYELPSKSVRILLDLTGVKTEGKALYLTSIKRAVKAKNAIAMLLFSDEPPLKFDAHLEMKRLEDGSIRIYLHYKGSTIEKEVLIAESGVVLK